MWTANLLQAFVFTLCSAPGLTVWGYTDVALSAVAAGWLTITTGGIEAVNALPVVWNSTPTAVTYLTWTGPKALSALGRLGDTDLPAAVLRHR